MWTDTLSLVFGAAFLLVIFSGCLILALRQFSQLQNKASEATAEAVGRITVLQSEALAKVIAPVFTPPTVPAQAQDLQEEVLPGWREGADSIDLIDDTGRPLAWETPVLSEAESMGPGDLWANPSQT